MAGVPITTPALTVNRLCGSGFQSIINGAHVSINVAICSVLDLVVLGSRGKLSFDVVVLNFNVLLFLIAILFWTIARTPRSIEVAEKSCVSVTKYQAWRKWNGSAVSVKQSRITCTHYNLVVIDMTVHSTLLTALFGVPDTCLFLVPVPLKTSACYDKVNL